MSIKTIYGENILKDQEKLTKDYILITDEIPWSLYKDEFTHKPEKVILLESLEVSYLDQVNETIDQSWEIVGLGGGSVVDAAKYFAYLNKKTPLLIPTITSSNAQFSDFISIRNQGIPVGMKKEGLSKDVLVDYKLIQQADARLNRAGYGDMLFIKTTINDWSIAAENDSDVIVDESVAKAMNSMIEEGIKYSKEIGELSPTGIKKIMNLFEESTNVMTENPTAPINAGSEHLFAWNLEKVTKKHFIHGEIVSLGILISAHLQGADYLKLKTALDEAQVIYLPKDLGISWEELKTTLLTVSDYNKEFRKFNTVYSYRTIDDQLLNEIYDLFF